MRANKAIHQKTHVLNTGDSLCTVYESNEDHLLNLISIIRGGFKNKENILLITDGDPQSQWIEEALKANSSHQFDLSWTKIQMISLQEILQHSGSKKVSDSIVSFIQNKLEQSLSKGYPCLRVSLEMSGVYQRIGDIHTIITLIGDLQSIVNRQSIILFNHYNRSKFSADILLEVLQVYPKIMINSSLTNNFNYISPDEYLNIHQSKDKLLNQWLDNLQTTQDTLDQLRINYERAQNLLIAPTDAIALIDTQGIVYEINPTALERVDKTREEMLGTCLWDALPIAVGNSRREHLKELLKKRSILRIVDYSYGRWNDIVAYPIMDDDNSIQYIAIISRDITEQKLMEMELMIKDRIIEESMNAIAFTNLDGYITYVNKAFLNMWGYDNKEEVLLQYGTHFWKDKDKAEEIKQEIASNEEFSGELKAVRKDGTSFDALFTSNKIYDESQVLLGITTSVVDITERKYYENVLVEEQQKMDAILSSLNMGLALIKPDLTIEWVNDQIKTMFPEHNPIGEYCYWFTEHKNKKCEDCTTIKTFETGQLYETERFSKRTQTWYHIISQPIKDEHGKVILVLEGINNITQRKNMEGALRSSEKKYKTLIENLPIGIVVHRDRKVQFINEAGVKIIAGQSKEEVIGKNIMDYVQEDYIAQVTERIEKIYNKKENLPLIHHKLKTFDGNLIDVEISGYIADFEGESSAIVMFQDVSKRIKLENDLQESKNRYKQLIESISDGVYVIDYQWRCTLCNQSIARFVRKSVDKIIGYSLNDLFPKVKESVFFEKYAKVMETREFDKITDRFRNPEGEIGWYEVRIHPVPEGILCIASDVTEKVRYEKQLQEALNQAQRADQLKSLFLANMSHEIRTPLNGIIGFVDLMLVDPKLSEQHIKNLNYVKASGKHLLELINDILELSKIEAGETRLKMENIVLEKEINRCLETANIQISKKSKDIQLSAHLDPFLPAVIKTDATKLKQICNNLLSNAVKFTHSGNIEMTIHKSQEKQLFISVKDSGIGIDSEKWEEIFKPFVQENEGISREYGGTGLGLSITRRLVELLGGKISLQSTKGEGSIFSFTLPYEMGETLQQEDRFKKKIGQSNQHYTILLVEDDLTSQVFMQKLLDYYGFQSISAINGQEALDLIESGESIDLILMDMRLPVLNGVELTKKIRKNTQLGQQHKLPIIAVTAATASEDRAQAFKAGVDEYLHKPFEKEELIYLIKKYLK